MLPNTDKKQKKNKQGEYMEYKQCGVQSTGLKALSSSLDLRRLVAPSLG